jgi:hypothetical protein
MERVIYSKQSLFQAQAPRWNFELDADQLLDKALELGFVKEIGDDEYLQDENYVTFKYINNVKTTGEVK